MQGWPRGDGHKPHWTADITDRDQLSPECRTETMRPNDQHQSTSSTGVIASTNAIAARGGRLSREPCVASAVQRGSCRRLSIISRWFCTGFAPTIR